MNKTGKIVIGGIAFASVTGIAIFLGTRKAAAAPPPTGDSLTGVVTDYTSGLPIAGISVTLAGTLSATTDNTGTYTINGLSAYVGQSVSLVFTDPSNNFSEVDTMITIKSGTNNFAETMVAVAGIFTATVEDSSTGALLGGVQCTLTGVAGTPTAGLSYSGTSGTSGSSLGVIDITNIVPGQYNGTLTLANYTTTTF
jgi:hypothetical protein